MKTSNLSYSVWGIFENRKKFFLQNLKDRLNKNLKGPKFPIHLTISSHFQGKQNDLIAKLKLASKKNKKFFIKTNNYGCKQKFFQSLFLKVKLTKELKDQKMIIDKYLNLRKVSYFPHASLFYGNLPLSKKKKIILNLKNFKKKIKIVQICLIQNDEKKLKWKIIKRFDI